MAKYLAPLRKLFLTNIVLPKGFDALLLTVLYRASMFSLSEPSPFCIQDILGVMF